MKKFMKLSSLILAFVFVLMLSFPIFEQVANASSENQETVQQSKESSTSAKAIASSIAIGLAGVGGAIGMGMAISKSSEAISRQPEAESKIRSTLMIGLVFIETVVIYAAIIAILIIFVL